MQKKSTHWDIVRKELRPKFAVAGLLETCELRWSKCLANKDGFVPKQFQTFAHSLRRRKIDKFKKNDPVEYERKIREVIRACQKCHDKLDNDREKDPEKRITHEKAEQVVIEIIKNRKKPVV